MPLVTRKEFKFETMARIMLLSITVAIYCMIHTVLSVQIFGGTSQLQGNYDQCGNYQEFSCVNDVCDPFAGSANNGRCRNGDDPSGTCPPNQSCSIPTKGHCLENTISAIGLHSTPSGARGQGTDKHFYCVTIIDLNIPVVLWENTDCTGQSCFIPGNGPYLTWAFGERGNCIDIGPELPVNTVPCLSPGELYKTPFGGGFPAGMLLSVGGQYGSPAAYNNTDTCSSIATNKDPNPHGLSVIPNPPYGDVSQAYFADDTTGFDGAELDRRAGTANQLTPVQGLRAGKPPPSPSSSISI